MRLLVLTRHSPLSDHDGAGAYLSDLLDYFAQAGVTIEVAWSKPPREWQQQEFITLPEKVASTYTLRFPGSLGLGRLRWMNWGSRKAKCLHFAKRLTGHGGSRAQAQSAPKPAAANGIAGWIRPPSPAEMRFFRERINAFKPDAVIANYCWLTPALTFAGHVRTAVLTHDVISARFAQINPAAAAETGPLSAANADGERDLLARAHTVFAITEEDAAVFQNWLPHLDTVLTPKSVRPASAPSQPIVSGRCLFIGGMNEPNRDGLAWFLANVWPQIRVRHSHATLEVCGDIASTVTAAPEGVILRGHVDSLATAYAQAQVVVVPLLQGSGMKIKLVEAASHGKACVTTPVGLQGLAPLRDHLVLARDADAFANGVNHLLANPSGAVQLGQSLQKKATSLLSPDQCFGPALAALFPSPVSSRQRRRPRPTISVLMPVYNAERYLETAITSILTQTWRDFELIAIDDGSTDSSRAILESFAAKDARVIVRSRPNTGIVGALNDGIALAQGEFLARMDADDEAATTRFAAQVARLRAELDLVAIGSAVTLMDANGHPVKSYPRPLDHDAIEKELLGGNGGAMIHPAVMFRTFAVKHVGGYRALARHVEDLDLFLRLARVGRLANLPSYELLYRVHPASVNFTQNTGRHAIKLDVLREALTERGLPFDAKNFPDGFTRYADTASHHREWAVTALAYGQRRVAVVHGWQAVKLRPRDPASWRALRYAITAPLRMTNA
jgi:glycosyltransferase involved in cell wall biosynthesis